MTTTTPHRRNRTTKGILAALLGLGLLGGYTTFALWTDSETVAGGTITTGNLDIAPLGTPTWADVSPAGATGWTGTDTFTGGATPGTPIANIASFLMVPGDLVEYRATQTIIATGDNMQAELRVDPGNVVIPAALTNYVKVGVQVLDATDALIAQGAAGTPIVYDVPKTSATGTTYTIVVRVGFDGDTPGQVGTTSQVNLSDMTFDLDQVRS